VQRIAPLEAIAAALGEGGDRAAAQPRVMEAMKCRP
jgi:hypothetical protein